MKKHLILIIAIVLCLSAVSVNASAHWNQISVFVEGSYVYCDQPLIIVDGRTLVPLRAVCDSIGAQVRWTESTQTATITKGKTTLKLQVGNNMMQVSGESPVRLEVPPQVYNGRILLPIRNVVERFGYTVQWRDSDRTVVIEEKGVIIVSGLGSTQAGGAANWSRVSPVQQFAYKDEGFAYAYAHEKRLIINTPGNTLRLEMRYPQLGDVIADEDGNFFIVWGKTGASNTEQTIFISKYSPTGNHIKTTGFVGESMMGDNGNTKYPFQAGNCVSAIGGGRLMVNYAREMYNGHQSNNVIGVHLSDMSPVRWDSSWNIPYTSHSFNQSIIWSENAGGFVYADHGDAFGRGFIITTDEWEKNLFHFYLEANSNYNMRIVNKTFAQLGGLAETSRGIALVGASAKSIGEAAKNEKQNLFIQIFDPLASTVSPSMFTGGAARSGATSTNIYDNSNSPLTSVTDYGVRWLTDYTGADVIAPQVVAADDQLVILWSTRDDTFYIVLSASGEIVTPATSLGGLQLNSFERPVYHDGVLYWVSVVRDRLKVRSLEI